MKVEKRAKGLVILLLALFGAQLFVSGCLQKEVEKANIKNVSLESEWIQVKKEVDRNMVDPMLVELRLKTDSDGWATLYSWQWVETANGNGAKTVYFAEKNNGRYKITSGTNTYSEFLKPVSIETAINIVDRYGLSKIFQDNSSASLVLRPAIDSKFSVINSKHALIKGNVEIDEAQITLGKSYIEGLYGVPNGNRQYMFSVE